MNAIRPLPILMYALLALTAGTSGCSVRPRGTPLQPGSQAPEFELADTDGSVVSLAGALAKGPTVLLFHRGRSCRYARTQLGEVSGFIGDFDSIGINVLAIGPDGVEGNQRLRSERGIRVPLLSDQSLSTTISYGVAAEDEDIPVPSVYFIDSTGTILWVKIGNSVMDTVSGSELLDKARVVLGRPEP